MGCESSGFFSLFTGQSAQCGPVNNQIQQMRANLDQITTNLERLRSGGLGGTDRENQRRSVLTALAQNNCGPQYANVRNSRWPGQLPRTTCSAATTTIIPARQAPISARNPAPIRTVCVRSCDGALFPDFVCDRARPFSRRREDLQGALPGIGANLYAYRNPGEDMNQAVSISGQPYTSSPNAFRFRQEFNPSCSCKAAGQTWSDALKNIDDKAAAEQQGDIIVTEERREKDGAAAAGQECARRRQERAPRLDRSRARRSGAGRRRRLRQPPLRAAQRKTRSAPWVRLSSRALSALNRPACR